MSRAITRAGSPEVVKVPTDSSPSSAESSFRELDDVFLQTQTRVWLGEVLHTRLDDETNIADLLADGELLFKVSKVICEMLLAKSLELQQPKAYIYKPITSGKSSGRYMPYSNVDSFLKVCKFLGLTSIDLFSPSDVVEKRDIRRVCLCIRSFSKNARSKHLNVPDFDVVTYTIAMPTDMVGCIRRSLELSQCSSLDSTDRQCKDSRRKYRQRSYGGDYGRQSDTCSEDSDGAESSFSAVGFYSSTANSSYDHAFITISDLENSSGGSPVVCDNFIFAQSVFKPNFEDQEKDRHVKHQSGSICLAETMNSLDTHNLNVISHGNCPICFFHLDTNQGTCPYIESRSMIENTSARSDNGHQFGVLDLIAHGTNDGVTFDGEDRIFNRVMPCHGSNTNIGTLKYGFERTFCNEIEEAEVSSTASLNSVSGKVVAMCHDEDQFDAEDEFSAVELQFLQNLENDHLDKSLIGYESGNIIKCEVPVNRLTQDSSGVQSGMKIEDMGSSTGLLLIDSDLQPYSNGFQNEVTLHNDINMSQLDVEIFVKARKGELQYNCIENLNECSIVMASNGTEGQECSPESVSSRAGWHHFVGQSSNSAQADDQWHNGSKFVPDYVEESISAPTNETNISVMEPRNGSLETSCYSNDVQVIYKKMNAAPDGVAVEENEQSCSSSTMGEDGSVQQWHNTMDMSHCMIAETYNPACCSEARVEAKVNVLNGEDSYEHSICLNRFPTVLSGRNSEDMASARSQSIEPTCLLTSPLATTSVGTDREMFSAYRASDQNLLKHPETLDVPKSKPIRLTSADTESAKADDPVPNFIDLSSGQRLESGGVRTPVDLMNGSSQIRVDACEDAKAHEMIGETVDCNVLPEHLCISMTKSQHSSKTACSENAGKGHTNLLSLHGNDKQGIDKLCSDHEDLACCTETMDKDKEKIQNASFGAVEILEGKEESASVGPLGIKPHGGSLLRLVAGGTTLIGGLFLLLHLRRKNVREQIGEISIMPNQIQKENNGEVSKQMVQQKGTGETSDTSTQIQETNSRKASTQKGQQKGRASGVYPTEKLRF